MNKNNENEINSLYELQFGDVVKGTAFRWNDYQTHKLEVSLDICPTIKCLVNPQDITILDKNPKYTSEKINLLLNISLNYIVKEIDYTNQIVFLSRSLLAKKTMANPPKEGEIIKGTITKINTAGTYADYNGLNCFCPKCNTSYVKGVQCYQLFKVGKQTNFVSLGWNRIQDTIILSYKDSFESLDDNKMYVKDDIIDVTLTDRLPESYNLINQQAYACLVDPVYFGIIQMPKDEPFFFGKMVSMLVTSTSVERLNGVLAES